MKCLKGVLLAVVGAVGCAQQASETAAPVRVVGSSPLVPLMVQAGQEFDVPADVLAAWAHLETRFVNVQPEAEADHENHAHAPPSHGVMGLSAAMVDRAAGLTGDAQEETRGNVAANIRAAAALLRAAADGRGHIGGALTQHSGPVAWLDAMADMRGISSETLRYSYLELAAEVIGLGLTGTDETGRTVGIVGRGRFPLPARAVVHQGVDPEDPYAAAFVASPHYSTRSGTDIDTIVIHTVQGSYSGCISWFQNPSSEVSAHYVVRSSDGQITQMVALNNRAWHAGNSNYNARSIGIEHEGYVADPGRWYTDAMYRSTARLVRWLADRYNVPMDRQHIIGHYQIPRSGSGGACATNATNCGGSGGHTDPGNGGGGWEWNTFMGLVTGGTGGTSTSSSGGAGTMRVVGVAYDASQDSTARIAGAAVTLTQNGTAVGNVTSSATGFWSFDVTTAATYTVRATAAGFSAATRDASPAAAGDTWASIGLTPVSSAMTGTYRGVVYSGAAVGESPVDAATVTLSTGQTFTTGGDGAFRFDIPAGDITATARKTGYTDASVMRTVTSGATTWGSIQLVANTTNPPTPPATPNPVAPMGGSSVSPTGLMLSFGRVADATSYDVELYSGDTASGTALATLTVPQGQSNPVGVTLAGTLAAGNHAWRVRAGNAAGQSPYSAVALFSVASTESSSSSSSSSGGAASSSSSGGASSRRIIDTPPPASGTPGDDETRAGCCTTHPAGQTLPAGLMLLGLVFLGRRRR